MRVMPSNTPRTEGAPASYQAIWAVIERIPAGRVASYGEVAYMAGYPRGHRLTAAALRYAPAGRALPWFRVLKANGRLAFEPGSPSYTRQQRRLQEENVPVVNGRVDLKRYGWRVSLDAEVWAPSTRSE